MKVTKEVTGIEQLLMAREQRAQKKLKFASEAYHVVSLQLNIPGLPKRNKQLSNFIEVVDDEFSNYFISHVVIHKWDEKHYFSDVSGDCVVYLFNSSIFDSTQLKMLTEGFEQAFYLGRIVDLDVLCSDGIPLSSGKAKKCFLCDEPAEFCRKKQTHSIDDVRCAMLSAIEEFMIEQSNDSLVRKVTSNIINGLLLEVSLSPKPGLVCRQSSGAHSDMDYLSFLYSISALSPFFIEIGDYAVQFKCQDVSNALPHIRAIGLRMEKAMFAATSGVNTHKGAVFLMTITCFSIIRCVKQKGCFKTNYFSSVVQQLTRGIVQRELCSNTAVMNLTHGQQCFLKYGSQGAGARGEAEQGLPTVLHHALPFINQQESSRMSHFSDEEMKQLLLPTLLKIMLVNNDTNVLFRHGKEVLDKVKVKAANAFLEWNNGNEKPYFELVNWCNQEKVSSGGSADLLAVTIALYYCQIDFSNEK